MSNRIRLRTSVIACAAAVAALGSVVIGGAAATADPGAEGAFLEQISLTDAALPGKTAAEMVTAGYATCDHLRAGVTVLDEISAVEGAYRFAQGTLFVSAATINLCPDFAG